MDIQSYASPYKSKELPIELQTSVINNIDDKAKDLVVHKRSYSTGQYPIVIQCKILKDGGLPCGIKRNILVNIHSVDKVIRKGITTVIINPLIRNAIDEGAINTQQYLLQNSLLLSQMSWASTIENNPVSNLAEDPN